MKPSDWRPLIKEVVGRVWPSLPYGPQVIEAQLAVESNGDPNAKSRVGAQGLMQLMPGTALDLGVKHPFDPRENLWGGVTYDLRLHTMLGNFVVGNGWPMERIRWMWAAYNAGIGRVRRALANVITDEDDISWLAGRAYLAAIIPGGFRETFGYVRKCEAEYLRLLKEQSQEAVQ